MGKFRTVISATMVWLALFTVMSTGIVVQGIGGIAKKIADQISEAIRNGENLDSVKEYAESNGMEIQIIQITKS